ncbi:MAG: flagellar biosynthesis protein FlhB [Rickettsiales bacterium]
MAEGEDQEQKTEQPTDKRLREAEQKGNIPYSRDVAHLLILTVLAFTVSVFAPGIFASTRKLLVPFLANADSLTADNNGLGILFENTAYSAMAIIGLPVMLVAAAAIFARYVQTGFIISAEPIKPKLNKISPLAGLKRIFSLRSIVELVKNVLKFIIVGFVSYIAVEDQLAHVMQLPNSTLVDILFFISSVAIKLMLGVLIAVFFIALLDVLYQRFQHVKSLKMSKQEIKDEHKQSEGDPMIKQRLRQLRMERAKQRMMTAVPQSDVVITNPTHYSVALQYDSETMKAPKVTAKGQDLIALKIREVAEENDIPIVENPPLARALFKSAEVDAEIPMTHYEAVAKVISYVYQLKGKNF